MLFLLAVVSSAGPFV